MPRSATAPHSRKERPLAAQTSPPDTWRSAPDDREPAATPDWRRILSAIDERVAGFEARMERTTAEFEAVALAGLQQSFGEAIRQAQERMKHYAEACGSSRLVDLEAELERRLEPFLNRSQAAISELERLLEAYRQVQATGDGMTRWHRPDGLAHRQDTVDLRLQRLSESLSRQGRL